MTAQSNTMWASRVRRLLSEGYGAEDIAVITKHSADACALWSYAMALESRDHQMSDVGGLFRAS